MILNFTTNALRDAYRERKPPLSLPDRMIPYRRLFEPLFANFQRLFETLDMLARADNPAALDRTKHQVEQAGDGWRVRTDMGWLRFRFEGRDVADVALEPPNPHAAPSPRTPAAS